MTQLMHEVHELEKKYSRLVWYARSNPASDIDFWNGVQEDIRAGAFKSQMSVEEDYPDEVTALRCPETGDWQHGFNSGMQAALRFISTADDIDMKTAKQWFPDLDS